MRQLVENLGILDPLRGLPDALFDDGAEEPDRCADDGDARAEHRARAGLECAPGLLVKRGSLLGFRVLVRHLEFVGGEVILVGLLLRLLGVALRCLGQRVGALRRIPVGLLEGLDVCRQALDRRLGFVGLKLVIGRDARPFPQ